MLHSIKIAPFDSGYRITTEFVDGAPVTEFCSTAAGVCEAVAGYLEIATEQEARFGIGGTDGADENEPFTESGEYKPSLMDAQHRPGVEL